MNMRLKAFVLHLLASVLVLSLVLGGLYLGWYRWPGWYLTGALAVTRILVPADVLIGPLMTLVIANPRKPRGELARDVAIIAALQLAALFYGAHTLWQGRPLYYAFSEDRLQIVQASDLDRREIERARAENPAFAPHWYSLARWVWAPLPADSAERARIIDSARGGGDDVIDMPRYFRPWADGLPALRAHLLTVAQQGDIRLYKKLDRVRARIARLGLASDRPSTLLLSGRGPVLVAVLDPDTLQIRAYVRADP